MTKSLTLAQAAAVLGCSRSTIYRLLWSGDVVAHKVRGSRRILEESLEAYRNRQIAKFQEEFELDS